MKVICPIIAILDYDLFSYSYTMDTSLLVSSCSAIQLSILKFDNKRIFPPLLFSIIITNPQFYIWKAPHNMYLSLSINNTPFKMSLMIDIQFNLL